MIRDCEGKQKQKHQHRSFRALTDAKKRVIRQGEKGASGLPTGSGNARLRKHTEGLKVEVRALFFNGILDIVYFEYCAGLFTACFGFIRLIWMILIIFVTLKRRLKCPRNFRNFRPCIHRTLCLFISCFWIYSLDLDDSDDIWDPELRLKCPRNFRNFRPCTPTKTRTLTHTHTRLVTSYFDFIHLIWTILMFVTQNGA